MRHCERSEAIHVFKPGKMYFVARAPPNNAETAPFHGLHFRSASQCVGLFRGDMVDPHGEERRLRRVSNQ